MNDLSVQDIRNAVKQLSSKSIEPFDYNDFYTVVHPRREAYLYWLGGRYFKAVWTWMKCSYRLKLEADEILSDMPWQE